MASNFSLTIVCHSEISLWSIPETPDVKFSDLDLGLDFDLSFLDDLDETVLEEEPKVVEAPPVKKSAPPKKAAPAKKPVQRPGVNTVSAAPAKGAFLELNQGDMVMHAAFGRGLVLSVMKMGGDALLEIAFDDIGTKKLMAKTASAHMKKL